MGIGFKELLIILAIALLIFGAKRLKTIGSDLGGAVKGFKKAMDDEDDKETQQLNAPSRRTPISARRRLARRAASPPTLDALTTGVAMFEVGFTEIVLILGLALLVLGPRKSPGLAEKVGRWTGRARAMARQLRTQLEQEVTLDEMTKSRPMQSPPPASPSPSTDASTLAGSTSPCRDCRAGPCGSSARRANRKSISDKTSQCSRDWICKPWFPAWSRRHNRLPRRPATKAVQ